LHFLLQRIDSSEIKQRTNMKFCFELGKMATKTHEMLVRIIEDAGASQKTAHKWFERFHGGSELNED
jgi:hypothetical protein